MRIHQQRRIHFEQITPPVTASFLWRDFRMPEGFAFNWHYHPEIELTLITSGKGLRFVGDSIERFDTGDLCLLGHNLPHTWSSDSGSRESESLVIQFLPDFWGRRFAELQEMKPVNDLLKRSGRGLCFGVEARRRVEPILKRLLQPDTESTDHLLVLLGALAELARTTDVRPLCRVEVNATVDERVGRRLKTVLDRVHQDIVDLPSQAELAGTIGLSPQAFSRFFKRQVGKTFVRYVNEWRVGLACRSLIETDDQITGVAVDSGFDNLSHFNRQFRRITGMTPGEYRARIHRND